MNKILRLLDAHLDTHPEAEIGDAVKFLYQASFGGGHMIQSPASALNYLKAEAAGLSGSREAPLFEALGDYVRLDLTVLRKISPETMNAMFVASAKAAPSDKSEFLALLSEFEAGDRFDAAEKRRFLSEYRAAGCPAVHHSDAFRAAYSPAYRVVKKEYAQFLEAFAKIDERMKRGGSLTVAIDGLCGSGKTTTAALLASVYDCNVFHADDFFLPPALRTPERFKTPGGNVHWERIKSEILDPLKTGAPFAYRVFDCGTMDFGETVEVEPKVLNILEGSYSMHPELIDAYDLKIFVKTSPEEQSARIFKRNPERHAMFISRWIPLENEYFAAFPVEKQCGLVFST